MQSRHVAWAPSFSWPHMALALFLSLLQLQPYGSGGIVARALTVHSSRTRFVDRLNQALALMIVTTNATCGCRGCGQIIPANSRVSMASNGPYHLACTPIVEDALAEHNRLVDPRVAASESTPPTSSAWQRLIPHAIAGILLVIALSPDNDIGYYRVMRWIVCAVFAYMAMESYSLKQPSWTWVWGVAAGIYNPIVPVEASRDIWSLVNLSSIALIVFDATRGVKAIGQGARAGFRFARTALGFFLRLVLALITIAVLLFIFDFVVTRWG